ncbi:unnamed protein product, partial [Musa textilis]
GTPGISRIGRYGDISGGNGRNFDRYRSAQLGNGRFRPLPPGNSTPTVLLGTPGIPLGTLVPYRTEQLSVHRYGTVLRTLV